MRTSKTRPSLNTSNQEASFRWQQCSQCSLFFAPPIDQHQCAEECTGLFLGPKRARLLLQEHKADHLKDLSLPSFMHSELIFLSAETMRLLGDLHRNDPVLLVSKSKDQQSFLRTGLVWPQTSLADNQLGVSKSILDQLADQQMIELRTIPKDLIEDLDHLTLRAMVPCESRSAKERRLISVCLRHQLANRLVFNRQRLDFVYLGQSIPFSVEQSTESGDNLVEALQMLTLDKSVSKWYRIHPSITSIDVQFESAPATDQLATSRSISLSDIGGLKKEKSNLNDLLLLSSSKNFLPPRGILLYGPKGCGKTMLINALAEEIRATTIRINPSDIYSRHYGESETKLKRLFAQTTVKSTDQRKTIFLLIVENIESLCPHQERITQQMERRLTTTFIELLDRYLDGRNVLLIATTNRIDSVDADLRRPGRIDEEIEIGIPNQQDRLEILSLQLRPFPHDLTEEQLKLISGRTHGFSGSDLENLCRKASHYARKSHPSVESLTFEHFENALIVVRPSSMREVILEVPQVKWSDIGGQHDLKTRLEEMVVWPLKYAHALDRLHVQVPKGILMYGPPGCSKTMVAKAIATESGLNFIAVKGPELFNKWVGESERAIRELFRRARLAAPAIIFFDEIDAIANTRSGSSNSQANVSDRVIATLLIEMDGIEKLKGVTIIAATNRPDCIDPALMRPGRFDRLVYVPLPDDQTRSEIFQIRFRHSPIDPNIQIERLVESTRNYSGAEIAAVCDEAALIALRENIDAVQIQGHHFERALNSIKPRTSDEQIRRLDAFTKQHGK